MASEDSKPVMTPQMLTAEFVGTFLLVFTVGCNVLSNASAFVGVSIACLLMVIIYAFGGISGGNFNPAVSVTLGIIQAMGGPVDNMPWGKVGAYCGIQILGGICGGIAYGLLFMKSFEMGPSKGFGVVEAGLCELIYTFMLCFVVANVAAAKAAAGKNEYYGLAIGFVVIAGAYGAGAVSGGCFNPAVAIGIDIASILLGFGYSMIYMVFELVGAALAAVAFKVVRPGDFDWVPTGDEENPPLYSKLAAEFLGTFMLVFTVGLNVLAKSPAAAFSIAASLMCMIYALGDVSGANFNPAVTLAIFIKDSSKETGMPANRMAMYMPTQIAGGIVAALMYVLIYHGEAFSLGAAPGYHWGQVIMAEFIFTFVLCMVVLCCAVDKKTADPLMFGLAIGSCVTVGGFAIGGISGGSLNPAVSWGIGVGSLMSYAHGGWIVKALVYTAVELAAGGAAAGLVMVTHAEKKEAKEAQ